MVAVQGKGDAMRKQHALLAVLFVALLVAMTSCSGDDSGGGTTADGDSGEGTTVDVVEKDFAIAPSPTDASAGTVSFAVTNEGPSTHEFVVFQTDLAPEDLPLADDGTV